MIHLSSNRVEDEAKKFARDWIKLLSQGKFDEAFHQLDEPNQYGNKWNVEKFKEIVSDYCNREKYTIDNPDLLEREGSPSLVDLKNGNGYAYYYNLPLNKNWSDLTLQFEFQKHLENYAVILHDVHVL
jgi:hypothetical protein